MEPEVWQRLRDIANGPSQTTEAMLRHSDKQFLLQLASALEGWRFTLGEDGRGKVCDSLVRVF